MDKLFKTFLQEKQYLCNLSPKTLTSYQQSYDTYQRVLSRLSVSDNACTEPGLCPPTKDTLKDFVIGMRESGLSPGACNVYIRSMNSFLTWLFENGHTTDHLRLKQVKGTREPIRIFKPAHIQALIRFKPRNEYEWRLHTLVCLLIDTGARIDEVLGAKLAEADLDQLLLRVIGKGRKTRLLPISVEMRKRLWVFMNRHRFNVGDYLFSTRDGGRLNYNNTLRDIKKLCAELGIDGVRLSPHGFRHYYSVNFVTQGGDLYRLSKILGHNSIKTTEIYLSSMGVGSVQQIHQQLSPLSRT